MKLDVARYSVVFGTGNWVFGSSFGWRHSSEILRPNIFALMATQISSNMLGATVDRWNPQSLLVQYDGLFEDDDVPNEGELTEVDVRDLAPPKPLQETLETLGSMDDDGVLVQVNDRVPQHLFPKLEERGYAHKSTGDDPVYTAIWQQ